MSDPANLGNGLGGNNITANHVCGVLCGPGGHHGVGGQGDQAVPAAGGIEGGMLGQGMGLGGLPGVLVSGHGGQGGEADGLVGDLEEGVVEGGENSKGNENFSEIVKENGGKVFTCNICKDNFDQPSKVKRHITMKHVKPSGDIRPGKRNRDGELEETDNKKHKSQYFFSESLLDEFDNSNFLTSTQNGDGDQILSEFEQNNSENDTNSVMEETVILVEPKTVGEASVIIKELETKLKEVEEESEEYKKKLKQQEEFIAIKDDALAVFKGTVNSMQEENNKLEARIVRFENAMINMKKEIDNSRQQKVGGDKNKKAEKELKESEQKVAAMIKKVEDLTQSKAKTESELVRMTKVCDHLQESLDRYKKDGVGQMDIMKDGVGQKEIKKVDIKCRQFESAAGCDYGGGCKFLHPSLVCEYYEKVGKCPIKDCKELHVNAGHAKVDRQVDCYFWTNGACRYSEAECKKGRHVKEKFGTNKRNKENFLAIGQAETRVSASHHHQPMVVIGQPQAMMTGQQHGGQGRQLMGVGQYQMSGGQHQMGVGQNQMGMGQNQMGMGQNQIGVGRMLDGSQQMGGVHQLGGGHQQVVGGVQQMGVGQLQPGVGQLQLQGGLSGQQQSAVGGLQQMGCVQNMGGVVGNQFAIGNRSFQSRMDNVRLSGWGENMETSSSGMETINGGR